MSSIPILKPSWLALLAACYLVGTVVGADARPASTDAAKRAEALAAQLAKLLPVPERSGEAPKLWRELVALGPDALPAVVAAMDDRQPVLSNYLRSACDALGEKALAAKQPLPAEALEKFVLDKQRSADARRVAYEWLVRADPSAPRRLLPGFLQDPSAELRRDAVAVVLKSAQAKAADKDEAGAKEAFQQALTGACDEDQVKAIVDGLKPLGVKVDVAAHYGFVLHWQLIAGFDNKDGAGFAKSYPPELGVDLKAAYPLKGDAVARWQAFTSTDPEGKVDLNVVLGKKKGVIAYAYAVVDSPVERTVQLRAGSFNALKIFLNGQPVFGRDEYHHGMRIDQHVATATLKKGRNELLVKVCQNEQAEVWAQSWIFQLRLCDAAGAAVPFQQQETKP